VGTPKRLDGKWLSAQITTQIAQEVATLKQKTGRVPGLGVILVGDNPASHAYVANKEKLAKKCGFETFDARLPASTTAAQILAAIEKFNADPAVNGILLQLPLPNGIDSAPLIEKILPEKDADGLHPLSQGLLMRGGGVLRPCTPLGSMKLIDLAYSSIDPEAGPADVSKIPEASLAGKNVVVIGRSVLVGKPVALLCLERNATVTMAHSKTQDLAAVTRKADIVIAAVGVPHLVKEDWVKDGAIVIDVGMNRLPDGKLTGDVDYEAVAPRCKAITPVPGGVGPMTVTMLILNTLQSFKARHA
jgi:methylenetetrahydrofolate dehydrogenase (NADP+)/methenyltetrahydrofolate cyclohydrolase